MRQSAARAIPLAIGLVVALVLLFAYGPAPLLYSVEYASSTPVHENTALLKEKERIESDRLIGLMQDVLDRTAPITLSIRAGDFESASRELERYSEELESVNRLAVSLDLSDSDVEEFRRLGKENLEDLKGLLEKSERFSALERLEVTYRAEGSDSTAIYTAVYEGEAIRHELEELYRRYGAREEPIRAISSGFNISSDAFAGSLEDFREVVGYSEQVQEQRLGMIAPTASQGKCRLTLGIGSGRAVYGEIIGFSGDVKGECAEGAEVRFYVDGAEWGSMPPDGETGRFSFDLPVKGLRTGTHIAHAGYGDAISSPIRFQVDGLPVQLLFSAVLLENGSVRTSGSLRAGEVPVDGAVIRILDGGRELRDFVTDAEGRYAGLLELGNGTHRLKASFDGEGLPLFPTESRPILLEVIEPQEYRSIESSAALVSTSLLIASALAAVWYVHRQGRGRVANLSRSRGVSGPPAAESAKPEDGSNTAAEGSRKEKQRGEEQDLSGELEAGFRELISAGEPSGAVHLLCRGAIDMLAARMGIAQARALTPREFLAIAEEHGSCPALQWLIGLHESVRYRGQELPPQEAASLFESCRSILSGADHEG